MKKRSLLILLSCLVLAWGVFLRFYELGATSWWLDEGFSVLAAQGALEHGYPILDTGQSYPSHLSYTYPLAGSIKAFGLSHWSTRLPAVIFNLIFLLLFYGMSRRMFNRSTALIATLVLSLSYWEIAWARQARGYTLLQLFYWAAIWAFWEAQQRGWDLKKWLVTLAGTAGSILTHRISFVLLPIFALEQWRSNREKKSTAKTKKQLKITLGLILVALIIFFKPLKQLIIPLQFSENIYLPHFLPFLGMHFLGSSLLAIAGLLLVKDKSLRSSQQTILLIFLTHLLGLTIISTITPYSAHRYLFPVWPALYLLAAVGLTQGFAYLQGQYSKAVATAICVVFAAGLIPELQLQPQNFYSLESDRSDIPITEENADDYVIYTPQENWKKAFDLIQPSLNEGELIISTQPVMTQVYTGDPGLWPAYSLIRNQQAPIKNPYVLAKTIPSFEDFVAVTSNESGFLILDYLSLDDRLDPKIWDFIQENLQLVMFEKTNDWSALWVYRF